MPEQASSWMPILVVAQDAGAGAAPATPQAQGVNPVGMPGDSGSTTAPGGQATQGQPAGPGGGQAQQPMFPMPLMWLVGGMFLLVILTQTMSGRKEKKRREELMSSMKKGDRVHTASGIIGTIAEMNDTEVVLRVEEGRVRFARSAIQGVIQPAKAQKDAAITEPKEQAKAKV